MTQQELEYHLKMLADSVQMLSCMIPTPEYADSENPKEAQQWFKEKLELVFYRCRDIINHK